MKIFSPWLELASPCILLDVARKTKKRGIEDLGNGTYRIRVQPIDPKTGKKVNLKRVVQAGSLLEAQRIALELKRNLKDPRPLPVRSKLGELSRAWLEKKTSAKRKDGTFRLTPNTRTTYTKYVKLYLSALDEYFVDRLTISDVEEWRDFLATRLSATSVNLQINILRMVLRHTDCRAADRASLLEVDDTRITDDEPNALTDPEMLAFLRATGELYPQHFLLTLLLFTTAPRVSTLLALRWEDIDPAAAEIHFRRRLSGREVLPGLKRSRLERDDVPLLPEVWTLLEAHRATLNAIQLRSGLVFPTLDGKHHSRSILNRPFRAIALHAGIKKRFTPHGCRRTASVVYRRVAGEAIAMAIAGHTTVEMSRHYSTLSHGAVISAEKLSAAERGFAGLLQKKSPPKSLSFEADRK